MATIHFPTIFDDIKDLSPVSQLAIIVGFKGALQEVDGLEGELLEFVNRAVEIGGELIDSFTDAGLIV
jgi:hypothetical protein